jgi:hypothetical protein
MYVVPTILSAIDVILADEIVRTITAAILARYPTRKTKSGGVLVTSRTAAPYSREVK